MTVRVSVRNLLHIAGRLEESHPLLAYELEQNTLALSGLRKVRRAVVNPGVQTWEEHIENMVSVLKSLEKEMGDAIREAETVNDLNEIDRKAEEFSVLFQETAEEEKLREYLENSSMLGKTASGTAGVKDFLQNIWKSVTDKKDSDPDSAEGVSPSYTLDEGAMDAIVEGKADWMDASQYIEEEFKENKDFFSDTQGLLDQMVQVRKDLKTGYNLDVGFLQEVLGKIQGLIKKGGEMVRGIRQHLLEPVPQVILEEDEDEIDVTDTGSGTEVWDLEGTVEHYIDVLRDNLGNEAKLTSLLKELFKKVGPVVEEQRGSLAARRQAQRVVLPVLIRLAHARPHLRPALLPVIRMATGR